MGTGLITFGEGFPRISRGAFDPSVDGAPGDRGSLLLRTNGQAWLKTDAGNTDWTLLAAAQLGIEEVIVTAAEIATAFDIGIGAAYAECLSFGAGDTVIAFWAVNTLDTGSVSGVYLDTGGRTSPQVDGESDTSFACPALDSVGTFAIQGALAAAPTLITGVCAGYLYIDAEPATGDVVLSMLVNRA